MDHIRHIAFFGGQGSRSLFSQSVASRSQRAAAASVTIHLLLSSCHSAFLGELLHLRSLGPVPSWAAVDGFQTPLDLLSAPERCHKNPVIQGVVLCTHQLVEYLHVEQGRRERAGSAVAGLCSGMLAAAVAASSHDVLEFVSRAKDAVRLAFWIGYRVGNLSARLGGPEWQMHAWSVAVVGLDKEEMERVLTVFEDDGAPPTQAPLCISGFSGTTLLSLTGDSRLLQRLRTQYIPAGTVCEPLEIYGLYHGGHGELHTLEAVLQDVKQRDISFPELSDLVIPILSAKDGHLLTSKSQLGTPFVDYVVSSILIDASDWESTWASIVQSNSNGIGDITVTAIGPGSYSFLKHASRAMGGESSSNPPRILDSTIEEASAPDRDGFAIVGMSVNFPLGATKEQFWKTLENGLSALQEIPETRFRVSDYSEGTRSMSTHTGNFLDNSFSFDHGFFNISPREAKSMDPQQKLLLQGTKLALDDAGYVPDATPSFQRDAIGCYIGAATDDYVQNLVDDIDVYYSPGTLRAFLSGKLSYAFGLSGPSMVIDTACSSSLVAIHQACRALQNGDCSTAIAGGVNAITSPDMFLGLARAHFLSKQGQCKAFDADADGYSRAEGCGIFIVKRLQDALEENDRIYGVIKEVEVNQSGNSKSITHPHGPTQASLFERLLARTGYRSGSISVVEAHGTGTHAGDATEISSIASVFGVLGNSRHSIHLTSIKSNIGHAEAASGAASLAKVLLMLVKNTIPPQIGIKTINPGLLALQSGNIHVTTEGREWTATVGEPRRALINNFGAAGSNAALIIQESPPISADNQWGKGRAAYNFCLSAKSTEALDKYRLSFIQMLRDTSNVSLQNLCYTVTARRQAYDHRIHLVCQSTEDLLGSLESGNITTHVCPSERRPVIFVCSGQGGCYAGMGKALLSTTPVFQRAVEACDDILESLGYCRVTPYLQNDCCPPARTKDALIVSQLSCFVVEYALASLWISLNALPDFVLGHSLGEYTALAISGAISLSDALSLVAFRAKLMAERCDLGRTGMLACNLAASDLKSLVKTTGDVHTSLEIGCINGAEELVLSGSVEDLGRLAANFERDGRRCKKLDVPLGFHSAALDPILEPFRRFCGMLNFHTPKFRVGSCYHGRRLQIQDLTPDYIVNQARGTVQFDALLASISQDAGLPSPTFIEIGPSPITLPLIKNAFAGSDCLFLPSLRRNQDPWITMCNSLKDLAMQNHEIDWRGVFAGTNGTLIDVPYYPFQQHALYVPYNERYGVNLKEQPSPANNVPRAFYLVEDVLLIGENHAILHLKTRVAAISRYITGHMVGRHALCPASVFHAMLLEASTVDPVAQHNHTPVVQDMILSRPLLHAQRNHERSIKLTLESPPHNLSKPDTTTRKFEFQSIDTVGDNNAISHCSGRVEYEPRPVTERYLALKTAYVKRQLSHLQFKHSQKNYFRTRTIYSAIFPRVVTYSDLYQTLKELAIVDGSLEAHGSFCSPAETTRVARDQGVVSPVFIDTLLHAAGFVANINVGPSEVCICSKVEACRVLVEHTGTNQGFSIYCSLLPSGEGALVGEAYAINVEGAVIAAVEGMHFQKLNLASFQRHLERSSSHRPDPANINGVAACPVALRKVEDGRILPGEETYPADRGAVESDGKHTILELLSQICEMPLQVIATSSPLSQLGIDSLMRLELCDNIRRLLPDEGLDMALVMGAETVQDLQDAVRLADGTRGPNDQAQGHGHIHHSTDGCNQILLSTSSRSTPGSSSPAFPQSSLIGALTSILHKITGIPECEITPHSPIRSLGVDSLLSIEMSEALTDKLGLTIPPEAIHSELRLSDLESLVSSQTSSTMTTAPPTTTDSNSGDITPVSESESFPVVRLTSLAKGSVDSFPLFLFHDGGGTVGMYEGLGNLGSVNCNVYGIANPDWAAGPHWATGLVDMAAHYAAAILPTSQRDEIVLGGWSFGGVLAHEIARQLISLGQPVRGVILIDAPCPVDHKPLPPPVIECVLDWALKPDGSSPTAIARSDHMRSILYSQFESHARFLSEYAHFHGSSEPKPSETIPYVMIQCEDVLDTTGLCGTGYPFLEDQIARAQNNHAWENFLDRKIKVLIIPGNHFEPFKPENIRAVSEQMQIAYRMIAVGQSR